MAETGPLTRLCFGKAQPWAGKSFLCYGGSVVGPAQDDHVPIARVHELGSLCVPCGRQMWLNKGSRDEESLTLFCAAVTEYL